MRRGRALLPHPSPLQDDTGRWLASRHVVAHLLELHVDMVRRRVPPVACHVATRTQLVDLEDAQKALAGKTRRAVS